jgi:LacI family transcriptional regulator
MRASALPVPPAYVFGNSNPRQVKIQIGRLVKNPENRPDAIFCSGDNIAAMVIDALKDFNLNVPRDLSVAGFGDLQCGRFAIPTISTIDERYAPTGARIVAKIIATLNNQDFGPFYETIRPRLILRDSSIPRP